MGLIHIEGMEFYAYHGCYREEQIVGNKFIVDLTLDVDTEKASESDNLNDTVNYAAVYLSVKEEMEKKAKLLEHVSKRIVDAIYANYSTVKKVSVKISKINPSLGGKVDRVSVTMEK